jgi:hypothetical protein
MGTQNIEKPLLYVTPLQPTAGTTTEFYGSIMSTDSHEALEEVMSNTRPGEALHADFPLLREIITMVVPKQRISPTNPSDKYTLVNISKRPGTRDMVFALVYKLFSTERFIPYDRKTHPLRAILRICVSPQGSRYMQVMALPSSVCMVSESPITKTEHIAPDAAWFRLLRNLDVSGTNTKLNPIHTERSWEHFCSRNARLGMAYAVKTPLPRFGNDAQVSMGPSGVATEFKIEFTDTDIETSISVNSSGVDHIVSKLVATHLITLADIGNTVFPGVYDMTLNNGYILSFTMPQPSRVRCSLLKHDIPQVFCDVNFMNNMVYADVRTKGIHSVTGMQRLALRAANQLQANLTPDVLAIRLRKVGPTTRELLGLMLSTDLHTDIAHVMARDVPRSVTFCDTDVSRDVPRSVTFCDTDASTKHTDSLLSSTRNQLKVLINSFEKMGHEHLTLLQNTVFVNSDAYQKKRVTSSAGPDRPRWQDHTSVESTTDGLLTQKMMSARGVATLLLYGNFDTPGSEKPFDNHRWVFSVSDIPRLVDAGLHGSSVRYSGSKTLSWLSKNDIERDARPVSFSYVMDKGSGVMRVSQKNSTNEKHTFAMFPGKTELSVDNLQSKIRTVTSDPKGVLVNRLLNFANSHPVVYLRALASFVLLDAVRGQAIHNQSSTSSKVLDDTICWSKPLSSCLNYYRTQFLKEHIDDIPQTTASADELYIQYSLFSQCLKQYMHGSRTPSDMFALLVQQGIPFPQV